MKKIIFGILLCLIVIFALDRMAWSQAGWTIVSSNGAPSGSCSAFQISIDTTTGFISPCLGGSWGVATKPVLFGTTGTITGTLLAVGACDSGTATVTGATVGMVAKVQANDGTALLPLGFTVDGVVTSTNTVTVHVCADILGTPPNKAYSVRVIQ